MSCPPKVDRAPTPMLELNTDKTQCLFVTTRQQLANINCSRVAIDGINRPIGLYQITSRVVRDLHPTTDRPLLLLC